MAGAVTADLGARVGTDRRGPVPPTVTDVTVVRLDPVIVTAWVAVAFPGGACERGDGRGRHVGEGVGACRCAAHRGRHDDRVGAGGTGGEPWL